MAEIFRNGKAGIIDVRDGSMVIPCAYQAVSLAVADAPGAGGIDAEQRSFALAAFAQQGEFFTGTVVDRCVIIAW